jgi:peptidoglycan hydrolase-like protein with peptidoglycan-binding domain
MKVFYRNKLFIVASFGFLGLALPGFAFAAGMVNLGTAENFVILAKTGISTTGNTAISGDIGVSPATASSITGFGLTADVSNKFSTSALVGGNLYAADHAVPTTATLVTAISDMETAYSEAASRPIPTSLGRSGGDIGALTFTPGLYKWNTGVTVASDVTLSGGADDVWIFQIAENLNVSSGVKIILTDGAQSKNIFWQVVGQTTLGTSTVFAGNILDQAAIVMKTGAVLNGRALAQTAVILDANTITKPELLPFTPSATIPAPVVPPVPETATSTATVTAAPPIPISASPAPAPSVEELQSRLNILLATLQTLIAQAKSAGISVPEIGQFAKPSRHFTQNLFLGSKGSEVFALQSFLIAKKIGLEAQKLATVGATGYFGFLTQKAVKEFQESAGIIPASGFFGVKTMTFINSL